MSFGRFLLGVGYFCTGFGGYWEYNLPDHKHITHITINQPLQSPTHIYTITYKQTQHSMQQTPSPSPASPTPSQKSLLLKKNKLQKHAQIKVQHRLQSQSSQLINSSGIVSPLKLMLVLFLIVLSVSSLYRANTTHYPHVRALTNYFSYFVLEQTELSIYDRGNNLDQTYIEITGFGDMGRHFQRLVGFVENYTVDGFAVFDQLQQQHVDLQYYYSNGSLLKQYLTFPEFKSLILTPSLRDLLLALRVLYFEIQFGNNKLIDNFILVFDYEIYSRSMLKLDMSTRYRRKNYQGNLREEFVLRMIQRFVAVLLMIAYSVQARKLYKNDQLDKQFRKNSLYWCISLILLNFISLVSSPLSPTCSTLQLLPILQNYDSSNSLTYNFNVNLRYSIPIVFRIIIPVYIILSGFILYSMLMYPGDYFDDYITGFFSYFYNNFQYGIYQIFIEIRDRGNSAYLMYVILYFYMVLVGSNLIPAFFCTLIYQKMAEKDLVRFIENRLDFVVCPKCKQEGYKKQNYGFEININSPKSPYLKSGTKLKHSHSPKQKITRMYIEEDQGEIRSPLLSPILSIKNKHKRARDLTEELKDCFQASRMENADYRWVEEQVKKIRDVLGNF